MGNRFGVRDVVIASLLLAVLISIWLAMTQYDRQWDLLQKTDQHLTEQTQLLRQISDLLEQGVSAEGSPRNRRKLPLDTPEAPEDPLGGSAGNPTSASAVKADDSDEDDPFYRLRRAQVKKDYAKGDWFIDVFGVAVGKLTPLISADIYAQVLENLVIEPLATRDPDSLEWRPWIAKSWKISQDGLTIEFELRENVRFSDGQPMTADDVVYTYNLIMNPKIAAPRQRAYYEKVQSVEKEGAYRVVFKLREPYFKGFEICAGLGVMAKHYYGQFTEEQFNEMPGLLFGSGPYKLREEPAKWRPGQGKVELVRNDRYWGVEPAFDRMVFREITDDTARLTTFINGEVDRYGATPEQYLRLKSDPQINSKATLYEYETIAGGYRFIGWNQMRQGQPTRFADKRVRQAMTMLMDRQEMCQRLMVGLATVATGPFHHLSKQVSANVKPWPYDPKQAKALLKQAGYEDRDGDGVIEGQDGQPFQFKLIYPAGNANYQQMALYLKDAYARAGIVLEPDPLEWTIMIQRMDQRDFDAITLGWSGTIESDPYQIFYSSQVADGGDNFVHYINKDLDQIIDQARMTVDEEERMKLWHRCHEVLHEDQPYTFLYNSKAVTFIDKRIRNVEMTSVGLNDNVEWYVPSGLQKWGK